jgi:uncharacterized membrane protein HdeD (DUF308 family)
MLVLVSPWWAFLARGILAATFGLAILLFPDAVGRSFALAFSAWVMADGAAHLIAAISERSLVERPTWLLVFTGTLGIFAGLTALLLQEEGSATLMHVVATWAVAAGILASAAAVRLREEVRGEWLLVTSGSLSILFGVALALAPAGEPARRIWIGSYGVVTGALLIALGIKLRGLQRSQRRGLHPSPAQAGGR